MQDTFARAIHLTRCISRIARKIGRWLGQLARLDIRCIPLSTRDALGQVRATIGYLVYKSSSCLTSDALSPHHHFDSLTYKPLGWAIGLIYKLKSIADA